MELHVQSREVHQGAPQEEKFDEENVEIKVEIEKKNQKPECFYCMVLVVFCGIQGPGFILLSEKLAIFGDHTYLYAYPFS